MNNLIRVTQYILAGLLVICIFAGAWWFVTFRSKVKRIAQVDTGRGAGIEAPAANPFGSTYRNVVSAISGTKAPDEPSPPEERAWHISATPVAGFGFLGSSTMLRYVERSTGYIFEAQPNTRSIVRDTNTLVPRVYEAAVSSSGFVALRTFEDGAVVTLIGSTTRPISEPQAFKGVKLARDIQSLAFGPSGKELFAIVRTPEGSVGIRSRIDGSNPAQVFASALGGWSVKWLLDGRIMLVQNPADGVTGYAYELKNNGAFVPVASGPGLTFLPRSSSSSRLIGTSDGGLSLVVEQVATTTRLELSLRTVAVKCVWPPKPHTLFCAVPQSDPGAGFLNAWYRGLVHSADQWWIVDTDKGSAEVLYAPSSALDVQDPVIDSSGSYILFKNAADQTLWMLRIAA